MFQVGAVNSPSKMSADKMHWYMILRELIVADPTEKPVTIYKNLIHSLNGNMPDDQPMNNDQPVEDNIKSTIARFKTKIKNDAKRTIVN